MQYPVHTCMYHIHVLAGSFPAHRSTPLQVRYCIGTPTAPWEALRLSSYLPPFQCGLGYAVLILCVVSFRSSQVLPSTTSTPEGASGIPGPAQPRQFTRFEKCDTSGE